MKNDPMKMQTADIKKVMCRDCIYRDRTTLKIDGDEIPVGVTRDTCLIYDGKKGNWKPTEVIIRNQACDFYERDDQA